MSLGMDVIDEFLESCIHEFAGENEADAKAKDCPPLWACLSQSEKEPDAYRHEALRSKTCFGAKGMSDSVHGELKSVRETLILHLSISLSEVCAIDSHRA